MRGIRVGLGVLVFAATVLLPVGSSAALPVGSGVVDPDVPAASPPTATVTVFSDEVWSYEEGAHTRTFTMPSVPWNRVVLELSGRPDGDPWDRLFGVAINGAEVLRGTTPRAAFSISKDVAAYLPASTSADPQTMAIHAGTWVGALRFSAVLRFYLDDTATVVAGQPPVAAAPVRWAYLGGAGATAGGPARFATTPPQRVHLELYTSGHSQTGEFWWMEADPAAVPEFAVKVDGQTVGRVTANPYVYALVGFNGLVGTALHPLLWWTAPRALDVVGIHTGIGEIPPYIVTIDDPARLDLFTGDRTVSVEQTSGLPYWVTSLTVLAA